MEYKERWYETVVRYIIYYGVAFACFITHPFRATPYPLSIANSVNKIVTQYNAILKVCMANDPKSRKYQNAVLLLRSAISAFDEAENS